jgi:hypothetical protein
MNKNTGSEKDGTKTKTGETTPEIKKVLVPVLADLFPGLLDRF